MCLSPRLIKKPKLLSNSIDYAVINGNTQYTYVPCGTCPSCIALKQSYLIQRTQLETLDNDLWFCTLTYNNEGLPTTNINGRVIRYPAYRDIQLFLKMVRKTNVFGSPFRYLIASEYGSKKGSHRPHWHLLFSTPKIPNESRAELLARENKYYHSILSLWRRNYGSRRVPHWKPLLTYIYRNGKSTYDFHYVDPNLTDNGQDDVAFYVTKYILKFNSYVKRLKSALYFNLNEKDFKDAWLLVKPRLLMSKGFGDIHNPKSIEYVKKCIKTSLDDLHDYPVFINPSSGQEFPLAPYLRRKFLTMSDYYYFYERNLAEALQSPEALSLGEYSLKLTSGHSSFLKASLRDSTCDLYDDISDSQFSYESPTCMVKLKDNSDISVDLLFDDDLPLPFDDDLPLTIYDFK